MKDTFFCHAKEVGRTPKYYRESKGPQWGQVSFEFLVSYNFMRYFSNFRLNGNLKIFRETCVNKCRMSFRRFSKKIDPIVETEKHQEK